MTFDIPEHATVQIFIGQDRVLAPPVALAHAEPEPAPRRGRPLLTGAGFVAAAALAFVVGQHSVARHVRLDLASNAAALPATSRPVLPSEQRAFPARPLPSAAVQPTAPASHIPPDFQRQLQQPPTVLPPPGAGGKPPALGAHPFGLED